MKKATLLLIGLAFTASAASAQVIYMQPFDNTTNQALITTKTDWNWAASDGGVSNTGTRQFGLLSSLNGIGGTAGFAYNSIGTIGPLAALTWYSGETISPSLLDSLSVFIGHSNNANETRFVIEVENVGWFATTQAWTNNIGAASNFPTQATEITFTTAGSAWRALNFDGLLGDASTGFDLFSGNQSANALAGSLPAGNITAVGVYHYLSSSTITRYDNFTIAAIPEPTTYAALFGLAALGLVLRYRRR